MSSDNGFSRATIVQKSRPNARGKPVIQKFILLIDVQTAKREHPFRLQYNQISLFEKRQGTGTVSKIFAIIYSDVLSSASAS